MALCADPNNTVFVVSGDSQENVEKAIGHIHGLGIAASNGACFAPPLKVGETSRRWKYFDLGVDWDAVKAVCRVYCTHTLIILSCTMT
jgi:trehalose 6-phosphate synthase/phosphatase